MGVNLKICRVWEQQKNEGFDCGAPAWASDDVIFDRGTRMPGAGRRCPLMMQEIWKTPETAR
jgi:hypothetical protein